MKVIVVGAGAAGMMAAGRAAQKGHTVDVYEKNSMVGKKIRITGKGRCNITNASDPEEHIANTPGNPYFMYSSLYRFTPEDTVALMESLGVPTKVERGKRVFPVSDKAADVAEALLRYMKKNGASAPSFDTIVAFGANSGNPHYVTGKAKLKKNMPVLLDFGCIYKDYCSDITRTFWFGDKPSKEFTEILNIVKSAHDEVVEKARCGQSGAEIDAIAREYIEAAGYGKYFTHRTGHGIGMQIHEEACLSQDNTSVPIAENYCFSVEPGIYMAGKIGVRHEDCFYMTKDGIKQIK